MPYQCESYVVEMCSQSTKVIVILCSSLLQWLAKWRQTLNVNSPVIRWISNYRRGPALTRFIYCFCSVWMSPQTCTVVCTNYTVNTFILILFAILCIYPFTNHQLVTRSNLTFHYIKHNLFKQLILFLLLKSINTRHIAISSLVFYYLWSYSLYHWASLNTVK